MRRVTILLLALAVVPSAAAAQNIYIQSPPPAAVPPGDVEFLSRFDFAVGLEYLLKDDPRFVWDAQFGGELDMVDYGYGRATFTAVYETMLGSQFRAFDPNQGNYLLEGSLSARRGPLELAGVFHHISRHLSDRPKRFPVDWNMIGGRVRGGTVRGRTDLQGRLDLRGVIEHTFVDYRWELDSEAHAQVALHPRTSAIAGGSFRVLGVDGSRHRGTQYGVRGEAGIRVLGRDAALDLFTAVERRIDPYQLELSTMTWMTLGFRITGR